MARPSISFARLLRLGITLSVASCSPISSTKTNDLEPFTEMVVSAESVSVRAGVGRFGKTGDGATILLHDFDFYEEKINIGDDEAKWLSRWFTSPGIFSDWTGEKKCGGFHPDYAIEWNRGSKQVVVLLCLSCHEIKAYFGNRSLRLNVDAQACDQVRKQFSVFQKK